MIEVSALLFTLLAEGTGLLSLILIIWIVIAVRKKSKDKAAATELVSSIKKQADDRKASIKAFLIDAAHLEAEELQLGVKKIDRLEKDFFSQLVKLYLKRDGEILSNMDEQLDQVITAYKESVSTESESHSGQLNEEITQKLETLENEKIALEEELKITKSTMGNMMTEFNTMFNGGNETVQTSKEALQSTIEQAEEENVLASTEDVVALVDDEVLSDVIEDEEDIQDSIAEETPDKEGPVEDAPVEEEVAVEDMDDDIFFSQDNNVASAPTSISESEDDFGSIVTTEDVDDILDGIDLSKEIDT